MSFLVSNLAAKHFSDFLQECNDSLAAPETKPPRMFWLHNISVHQKTNLPPQVRRCHLLFLLSEPYHHVSCHGLLPLHFSQHSTRWGIWSLLEQRSLKLKHKKWGLIIPSIKQSEFGVWMNNTTFHVCIEIPLLVAKWPPHNPESPITYPYELQRENTTSWPDTKFLMLLISTTG